MVALFGDRFSVKRVQTEETDIHLVHGGEGPPLLLLHGYPQTHVMWHRVAPVLAQRFYVICPDLRGYGDSGKPTSRPDHSPYSKRAMAADMAQVMSALGYESFLVAGHDRGARVVHRLALDYSDRVLKACVMDIVPTYHMYQHTDQAFAQGYYHWFFLTQPDGLPERLIGGDPEYYLREKLNRWSAPGAVFDEAAVREYVRCFNDPATIHATCEDYRAGASIDLVHDEGSLGTKVTCPLLVLWGSKGFVNRTYNVLSVWREYAFDVNGGTLACGHFLAEECEGDVVRELTTFFGD